LSDDWASERYGNGFVSADESRLYAIVRSLKLAVGGEAQRYTFSMQKFSVALSQKRVGLPACNKDV